MKTLTKTITVGEYTFKVGVDRAIVADAFEEYPDLIEFLFANSNNGKAKEGTDIVINAVRNKNLEMLLDSPDQIKELVKYAFPKMLKKGDDVDGTDNKAKADEIYDYIVENEVDDEFSNAMFEFICLGFTPETNEKKPKVKFIVK